MKKLFLNIVIAILTFSGALTQDYSNYNGCAEQDSLALVAFFHATGGPNWTTQTYAGDEYPLDLLKDDVKEYYINSYPNAGRGKWLIGPVKDWFGILLEKQQVKNTNDSIWRVIHLRPTIGRRENGNNNLQGHVPKEVGLLTALEWFKINGNSGLSDSELPGEIYHSTLLKIDIEKAFLSGDISNDFRNCTRLDYINLRYNNIDTIPALDFLTKEHLLNTFAKSGQPIWFYDTQLSYASLEPTVKHFRSISDNIIYEARNLKNVGTKQEVILEPGGTVTLTSNAAGEEGSYIFWNKDGTDIYTASGQKYTVNSVGSYTVRIKNDYIRENDDNQDYINCYTKPINVVNSPTTPVCEKIITSYSGKEIILEFDKYMAVPNTGQASEFMVKSGQTSRNVTNLVRTGRLKNKLILTLDEPVEKDSNVVVSYTQGTVVCKNGGEVNSFSNVSAVNYTREIPSIIKAETYANGECVILTFDKFIDKSSINKADFNVTVNGNSSFPIYKAKLIKGDYDDHISKKAELIFNEFLKADDIISVSYSQANLTGLYGGMPKSIINYPVENTVDSVQVDFVLSVIDGTENLENIVIKSDIRRRDITLVDDATMGDAAGGDNTWSYKFKSPQGTYNWEVYKRTLVYDTLQVNGDTVTLVVNEDASIDSLISSNVMLELNVNTSGNTGDTIFGYYNNTITFILDLDDYLTENPDLSADPYLMGIDEDWTEGIAMSELSTGSNMFIVNVEKRNTGDILNFNFRNGSKWENESALYRTHIVSGSDTITAGFSDYISSTFSTNSSGRIELYPNPATSFIHVFLQTDDTIENIEIIGISGNVIKKQFNTEIIHLDLLPQGLYCIKVVDSKQRIYYSKFLKL
jgi:hypothetical protein